MRIKWSFALLALALLLYYFTGREDGTFNADQYLDEINRRQETIDSITFVLRGAEERYTIAVDAYETLDSICGGEDTIKD